MFETSSKTGENISKCLRIDNGGLKYIIQTRRKVHVHLLLRFL